MSELVLINPRRKSRRRRKGRMPPGLARYWASRGRRKLRRPKRSRARRRRRSVVMAASHRVRRRRLRNPRRLHRRRRHLGGFRVRRRRVHRNPRFGVPSVRGIVRQTLMPAAVGAGGALALDVAYGYASPYLPAFFQNKWATLGVKIVGALGIGMLAGKFLGRERGRVAMLGAATVVVYGAAKSALSQALPTVKGLSGYSDFVDYSVGSRIGAYMPPGGMGFYSPAATIAPSGVGAYMPPNLNGLEGVDGYNWQNDGM